MPKFKVTFMRERQTSVMMWHTKTITAATMVEAREKADEMTYNAKLMSRVTWETDDPGEVTEGEPRVEEIFDVEVMQSALAKVKADKKFAKKKTRRNAPRACGCGPDEGCDLCGVAP